ncbi:hypothetical protein SeMB42_g07722 [Synchytrium endobioticum]|uniref:Ribonucleases P/MRP subunit Pop8-like domain-containing protein n=1 Tax=Synchytrium endobioticum TaxID=286115 RepID=A0A507BW46_9FUNG|nr:hypothetical protein SeMB42_g07722 [Synchytrium endobioticum]
MGSERIVVVHPTWQYMSISLTTEPAHDLDELYFRNAISIALRDAFGIIGMSTPIDVLTFDLDTQHAVIRVPSEYLVQVRSALSLLNKVDGTRTCRFHVHQASSHLMSLACDLPTAI